MSAFDGPSVHTGEAREALRRVAHAIGRVENPAEIGPVLSEVSDGLVSLGQALHQAARLHDGGASRTAQVAGGQLAGRTASYQVSWELHRAAEMVRQVAASIDRAHEVEATITYDVRDFSSPAPAPHPTREPGLSL